MTSLELKLDAFGKQIVDRLKDDIKNKRVTKFGSVNSSGKLADSVRHEVTANGLTIWANDYIYYLIHGRKPGKFPPKAPILQWIKDKPINSDIKPESLAFLIQRKISKKGTTIFQQGGSDLLSGITESEFFTNIVDELSESLLTEITSEVVDAL